MLAVWMEAKQDEYEIKTKTMNRFEYEGIKASVQRVKPITDEGSM